MEKIVVWTLVLVLVGTQDPDEGPLMPEECVHLPDFRNRHCCVFPPFFAGSVARECGSIGILAEKAEKYNVSKLVRADIHGCGHWACLLQKYHLIDIDNRTVSIDKFYKHLDRWVELNPSFEDVIKRAKFQCKNNVYPFLPLLICEFPDINFCIRAYVDTDCPVMLPTPECTELKEYYDKCRSYVF